MANERKINDFLKDAGYEPREGKTIIVKYAPENLSDQIAKFFSMEFYVLQICKKSIVLVPFNKVTVALKKEVALEIPFSRIRSVSIIEKFLNYLITLETEDGTINLSTQQAELSEWRTSGSLTFGGSILDSGISAAEVFKGQNWHRKNLEETLEALKNFDFCVQED